MSSIGAQAEALAPERYGHARMRGLGLALVTAVAAMIAVLAVAALAWPVMHVGDSEREAVGAEACQRGLDAGCRFAR